MSMKKILIFPSKTKNNEYLNRMSEIFSKAGYEIISISVSGIMKSVGGGEKYAYLNWVENQTRQRGFLGLILIVGLISWLKILRYRIVWVQHNKRSHDVNSKYARALNDFAIYVIKICSDYVVCHGKKYSRLGEVSYLPHPTYKKSISNKESVEEIKNLPTPFYLVFGRMLPYKKIEEFLLNCLPCNLVIAGSFDDEYLAFIKNIVTQSKAKVEIIDRFVSDKELEELVENSESVLITNDGESSIVSGVVYHILSIGGSVFTVSKKLYDEISPLKDFYLIDAWSSMIIKDSNINSRDDIFYLNSDEKIIEEFEKMVKNK